METKKQGDRFPSLWGPVFFFNQRRGRVRKRVGVPSVSGREKGRGEKHSSTKPPVDLGTRGDFGVGGRGKMGVTVDPGGKKKKKKNNNPPQPTTSLVCGRFLFFFLCFFPKTRLVSVGTSGASWGVEKNGTKIEQKRMKTKNRARNINKPEKTRSGRESRIWKTKKKNYGKKKKQKKQKKKKGGWGGGGGGGENGGEWVFFPGILTVGFLPFFYVGWETQTVQAQGGPPRPPPRGVGVCGGAGPCVPAKKNTKKKKKKPFFPRPTATPKRSGQKKKEKNPTLNKKNKRGRGVFFPTTKKKQVKWEKKNLKQNRLFFPPRSRVVNGLGYHPASGKPRKKNLEKNKKKNR